VRGRFSIKRFPLGAVLCVPLLTVLGTLLLSLGCGGERIAIEQPSPTSAPTSAAAPNPPNTPHATWTPVSPTDTAAAIDMSALPASVSESADTPLPGDIVPELVDTPIPLLPPPELTDTPLPLPPLPTQQEDASPPPPPPPPSGDIVCIESCIASDFDGLEYGNIYELCNGQIWKQTEFWIWYWYWFRPQVLICPEGGGYVMHVQNIDHAVRVERLQ
jgi:hypothetical protein